MLDVLAVLPSVGHLWDYGRTICLQIRTFLEIKFCFRSFPLVRFRRHAESASHQLVYLHIAIYYRQLSPAMAIIIYNAHKLCRSSLRYQCQCSLQRARRHCPSDFPIAVVRSASICAYFELSNNLAPPWPDLCNSGGLSPIYHCDRARV